MDDAGPDWAPLPQRARRLRRDDGKHLSTVNTTETMAGIGLTNECTANIAAEEEGKDETAKGFEALSLEDAVTYEYLDHTADVQLHAWGKDVKEALEGIVVCMFGYMTELETVDIDSELEILVEADGHDMLSLLYNYMDEFLFQFATEDKVCKRVKIETLDLESFSIKARGFGERFDIKKHPQGTEIKAITYSNMQVRAPEENEDGKAHIYVIVDI